MQTNAFYWDFRAQAGIPIEKVRLIKANNHSAAVVLNQLAKALRVSADGRHINALRQFRQEIGFHKFIKHDDSETGMNTYSFSERVRFLADYFLEHPEEIDRFNNTNVFELSLSYLFSGYSYVPTQMPLCDKFTKWREYTPRPNCPQRFAQRDPLTIALYLYKTEDVMPIGLDYPRMLREAVADNGNRFAVRFPENSAMIAAAEQLIYDLKTNESFYINYDNHYYSEKDNALVKQAIWEKHMAYQSYLRSL